MNRSAALFVARLFTNTQKDMFSVKLGVALLLAKFGIVGSLADFLSYFIRAILGALMEEGTFLIDIKIDAYKEGKKLKEFEQKAGELYAKAMAKKYTEDQKNAIRKEYLEIISRIGAVGNPRV